ncbi:hypothetical protein DYB32_010382, partial [Aphanomyces invadans]
MAHDSPVFCGRYLQIHCTLGAAILVLHNVYAPETWTERARFFDALPRDFLPHFLHVVGGDFNCTLNKHLDSLSPSTKTMAGTGELTAWMSALSVVDLFRHQNPLRKTFTSPKLVNRLDYIFCSSQLTRLAHWKAAHMPHIPNTDHVACRIVTKREAWLVNGTLNDSGHLPGALQPLEVAGTSRAARRETTGGNLDPIDPVARDAGEDDPAEAVLLGSPPTLVGAADPRAVESRHQPPISREAGDGSPPSQQPIRTVGSEPRQSPLQATPSTPARRVVDLSDPLPGAPPTAPRNTYASVLGRGGSHLPSGTVKATLSRPTRTNLAKLMELASDEATTDEEMFQAIEASLPYRKRIGTTTFWIETNDALASQSNDKIIKSLFEENRTALWAPLLQEFVQVNKARGGDVVVTVTDDATRLGMLGQSVRLLGKEYPVAAPPATDNRNPQRHHDDLQDLYFMDIVGTRFNFDSRAALKALRRLKTNPIFISYKLTYSSQHDSSCAHPNIWRVYFNTPFQPPTLSVHGHTVDQIILHGIHYGVYVKDFQPAPSRPGRRSPHVLDLDKFLVEPTTSPDSNTHTGGNKRPKVSAVTPTAPPARQSEPSETSTTTPPIVPDEPMLEDFAPEEPVRVGEGSSTQSSTEVFQSMVDGMEVDDFEKPRKPLKRTREEDGNSKSSWITSNMYDALSNVTVTSRTVILPQDIPVNSYCMDIATPLPTTFHS